MFCLKSISRLSIDRLFSFLSSHRKSIKTKLKENIDTFGSKSCGSRVWKAFWSVLTRASPSRHVTDTVCEIYIEHHGKCLKIGSSDDQLWVVQQVSSTAVIPHTRNSAYRVKYLHAGKIYSCDWKAFPAYTCYTFSPMALDFLLQHVVYF